MILKKLRLIVDIQLTIVKGFGETANLGFGEGETNVSAPMNWPP